MPRIPNAELERLKREVSLDRLAEARGITLTRKGDKDRVVPIGDRALAWLERYLAESRPLLALPPDESFLFLTYLVARYVDRAELGKKGSCHLLRGDADARGRRRLPLRSGDAQPWEPLDDPDVLAGRHPQAQGSSLRYSPHSLSEAVTPHE